MLRQVAVELGGPRPLTYQPVQHRSRSRLHPGEREGAWLEWQRVVAENRVAGGAGAAGIPTGGRVGSKGQAEVKVL